MKINSAYVTEGELSWNIIGKYTGDKIETTITIGTINKEINGAELYANQLCDMVCLVEKVMKGPTVRGKI